MAGERDCRLDPAQQLLAAVCLTLTAIYLLGWTIYVLDLPNEIAFGTVPIGMFSLLAARRWIAANVSDALVRNVLVSQVAVLTWNLAWLAVVMSYSGGGWTGDWFGHWQRCQFFLKRPDVHILFNGFDPLPSRPPLVNVVVAAWLVIAGNEFASYQVAMTVWSSLAFLPAALLAIRAARAVRGGSPTRAIALLPIFFMLSPMAVQNATFAWTKLPAAVFTLAAVEFFLAARPWAGDDIRQTPAIVCGMCVAAALLAHYSAAPYAIVLAGAWLTGGLWDRPRSRWFAATAASALAGLLLLTTWFGWALTVYGPAGTFLSNTTATDRAATPVLHAAAVAGNIFDTIVPHFLRSFDRSLIRQSSRWGFLRDWWFMSYQVNLIMIFGSTAWIVVLVASRHLMRGMSTIRRATWIAVIGLLILLGIGAVSGRDHWGVAHVCLQPLVLAGLACVAGCWGGIAMPLRWLFVVGAAIDFVLGILLHYAVQGFIIDRRIMSDHLLEEIVQTYSPTTAGNFHIKEAAGWRFIGDSFTETQLIPFVIVLFTFGMSLWHMLRQPPRSQDPSSATQK